MDAPIPAQKAPYNITVEEGKRYFWCACGRSGARWLVLVGVAMLSGCGWVSGWFSSSSPSAPKPEERPVASCPSAVILRPLGQTAVFGAGQPRQPAGVAFYGVLSEVDAQCERS